MNGTDLSQYSNEELEKISGGQITTTEQSDLSSYSDEDLLKIAREKPQGQTTNLLSAFGMGAGGAVGVYGAKKAFEISTPARTKVAGNLMNSIIKPRHKEYMFGKNPGKGIAQEGIWGINIESIGSKVDKRLNELTEYAKQIRSLNENTIKRVNLETILKPIKEVLGEFEKAPLSNKGIINKVNKIIQDIKSNIPEGSNIKDVPIENAYGLKKVIENLQKWEVQSSADDKLNIALKRVYHEIDSSIDVTVPELKSVNSRISNLISAKQAIKNRVEMLSKQDPTSLGNLLSLPIKGTVGSTIVKSGLAKILAEKFGMVGNVAKKVGNIGKKALPALSLTTSIFDAMKYAKDPLAYTASQEGGMGIEELQSTRKGYQEGTMTDEEKIRLGLAI